MCTRSAEKASMGSSQLNSSDPWHTKCAASFSLQRRGRTREGGREGGRTIERGERQDRTHDHTLRIVSPTSSTRLGECCMPGACASPSSPPEDCEPPPPNCAKVSCWMMISACVMPKRCQGMGEMGGYFNSEHAQRCFSLRWMGILWEKRRSARYTPPGAVREMLAHNSTEIAKPKVFER